MREISIKSRTWECLITSAESIKTQREEERMRKAMIQIFVVSVVVASYALPVLACGGAGL